jgi:ribosomal protein S18 acetylase RimI-like enzyme
MDRHSYHGVVGAERPTVRRIGPEQRDAAAATLAEAFLDDPLMLMMSDSEAGRRAVGPWFFRRAVAYGLRWGEVWGSDDASAVAVWLPPGDSHVGTLRMIRVGLWSMPFRIGLRPALRFLQGSGVTERFHAAVPDPHWYLMLIGTRRERQGQGLASALLDAVTSRADADGLPCYLETGTDANVPFYERRGFAVTGEAEMNGSLIRAMVRPPRR